MKKIIFCLILLFMTIPACADPLPDLTYSLPSEAVGNPLAAMGYLDIQLYAGVDETGVTDSLAGIQKAQADALTYDLVLYFRHQSNGQRGVYRVSDRIDGRMTDYTTTGVCAANVFIGEVINGVRPLIVLASGANGYQDINNPKPIIEFWAVPYDDHSYPYLTDPQQNQADISFEQMFRSIDIDCNGNPGAIGIKNMGAQGATIENISINATGAFAGIGNIGGIGTASHDITVNGGRYSYYINTLAEATSRYNAHSTLVGCKFNNPTVAHVGNAGRINTPLAFIGCNFQNTNSAPLNSGYMDSATGGGWTFNDCLFDVNTANLINTSGRAVYVRNSYVRGADSIITGVNVSNPDGWSWIKELSIPGSGFGNLINGSLDSSSIINIIEDIDTTEESINHSLIDFHTMDESAFPTIQDNYYSVKTAGAVGNGVADDTTALNNAKATALSQGRPLFFPKGQYQVNTNSFELPANLKVFGCSRKNTVINPIQTWQPASETYVVTTEDDADGTAVLSDIAIGASSRTIDNQYYFTPVNWRVGRNSKMRDVVAIKACPWSETNDLKTSRFKVTGHGGGKWYGALSWSALGSSTLRGLFIENTDEPMWIYPFNNQQAPSDVNLEIKNSDNKVIYHMSQEECITDLRISDSDNVYVATAWKNNKQPTGANRGHYEFVNCTNSQMTMGGVNIYTYTTSTGINRLRETYSGSNYSLVDTQIAVFKRGEPDYISIDDAEIPVTPSAVLSLVNITDEYSIANGGGYIDFYLTNDTFKALTTAIKSDIRSGIDSNQFGSSGWDQIVKPLITDDIINLIDTTHLRIGPLAPAEYYNVDIADIITCRLPASSLDGGQPVTALPAINIDAVYNPTFQSIRFGAGEGHVSFSVSGKDMITLQE